MYAYLINTLCKAIGRCFDPIIDSFVCNAIRMVAALLESAVDLLGRGVERIGIPLLNNINGLVCEPIRAYNDWSKASLERLRDAVSPSSYGLRCRVGCLGVHIICESRMYDCQRVADEWNACHTGEHRELRGRRSSGGCLYFCRHCWETR